MFRTLILATILLTLTGRLVAETPATDVQIEQLGAFRLRVSSKLNNLAKATDNTANGVNAANDSVATAYTQTRTEINKRQQTENSKAGDARDQLTIDALNVRSERVESIWNNDYQRKDAPAFNSKIAEINNFANNLAAVYQNVAGADQAWLRTGLDPLVLTAVFVALDKRLDQLIADAKTFVADYKTLLDERARKIKE